MLKYLFVKEKSTGGGYPTAWLPNYAYFPNRVLHFEEQCNSDGFVVDNAQPWRCQIPIVLSVSVDTDSGA
jgi:hypothetical protein